jgi:hypothetical protein
MAYTRTIERMRLLVGRGTEPVISKIAYNHFDLSQIPHVFGRSTRAVVHISHPKRLLNKLGAQSLTPQCPHQWMTVHYGNQES